MIKQKKKKKIADPKSANPCQPHSWRRVIFDTSGVVEGVVGSPPCLRFFLGVLADLMRCRLGNFAISLIDQLVTKPPAAHVEIRLVECWVNEKSEGVCCATHLVESVGL